MRIFLESGHGFIYMGLVFLMGFLAKGAVSFRYKRLMSDASNLSDCRQKQLKQMKVNFENLYHQGKGMVSAELFADSAVYQIRALGVRAERLSRLGGQAFLWSAFLGVALASGAYAYGLDERWMLYYGAGAALAAFLGAGYTVFLNVGEKREYLRAVLKNQFGNVWKARLDLVSEKKGRNEEKRGEEIAYLKQSLDRIAASKEPREEEKKEEPEFSDSEKEAFEEILKDYFS